MNRRRMSSFGGSKNLKKRYYNKKLENPFFRKRKKTTWQAPRLDRVFNFIQKKIIFIILTVVLIGGIYVVFFSKIFALQNINISGVTRVPKEEVINLVWQQADNKLFSILPQTNLLIFDKNKLYENLSSKYNFSTITINKKLLHNLEINIEEKTYAIIWLEGEKYYYTDLDGYIMSEVNPQDIKDDKYPIIENRGNTKIENNKVSLSAEYINYLMKIHNKFKSDISDLKIEKFISDKDVHTVKVKLTNGPEVYFNTKEDLDKQITKMLVLKDDKLKNDFNRKIYIDLRFGDKIYYR